MSETERPPYDPEAIAHDARAHGLVVIAGAGVSMGPPSSLPGWTDINNAFLEGLAMRLAMHGANDIAPAVLQLVLERRDAAAVAQPDLQAQLAEESLGEHYFGLFRPLDIETWNDGHAAVAALAATGTLRAVVTTNFDRLIELAIAAAGGQATVYCSPDEFDRLPAGLAETETSGAIPVIKVHGSVDRASTMVDTLRQRVVGRPKVLEAALTTLFSRHAVLVLGFSGADLAYDPHYLGLRGGAAASPSFTVVNRQGSAPAAALAELVDAAGSRARIVDGTLPESLILTARALGHRAAFIQPSYDVEMEFPGMRRAVLPSEVHRTWAQSLSPVSASVVLASIARTAGSEDAAFRLLMETMPHHLRANLHADPAMPAQLNMIASTLIEACHVDPELSAGTFSGEAAFRVLSVKDVAWDAESFALRSLGLALCGHAAESDGMGLAALRMSRESFRPALRADVVCILARAWTLTERWSPAWAEVLRQTYDMIAQWGDEPRRARVGALLARFLLESGRVDDAATVLFACQPIVRRLSLAVAGNDLVAVGGRLYLAEGRGDKALSALTSACRHQEASQHNLRLAETLLPLAEAAVATGRAELLQQATARFDALVPVVPGLSLPYAASRVRLFCSVGAFDDAREVVTDLVSLAERWGGHPWVPDLATRLQQRIGATQGP
jgi:hypothetical protein